MKGDLGANLTFEGPSVRLVQCWARSALCPCNPFAGAFCLASSQPAKAKERRTVFLRPRALHAPCVPFIRRKATTVTADEARARSTMLSIPSLMLSSGHLCLEPHANSALGSNIKLVVDPMYEYIFRCQYLLATPE